MNSLLYTWGNTLTGTVAVKTCEEGLYKVSLSIVYC